MSVDTSQALVIKSRGRSNSRDPKWCNKKKLVVVIAIRNGIWKKTTRCWKKEHNKEKNQRNTVDHNTTTTVADD